MRSPCAKPCPECPWRVNAAPGWLGPNTAEEWVGLAHSDAPIACHLTITNEDDLDSMVTCAGAAIYRSNVAKMPRGVPKSHKLPADRQAVFTSPMAFRAYHEAKP